MISTRDFLLYVLVLGFLVMVVAVTWVQDSEQIVLPATPKFTSDISDPTALSETHEKDRGLYLADLKAKLAAGEGQILSAPPVLTSVDSVVINEAVIASSSDVGDSRVVQYCSNPTPHQVTVSWPDGATLEILGVTAQLTAIHQSEIVVGTTTELVTEETLLASIPLRTIRSTFDSCLPDTTVGVTPDGDYLTNTQAERYKSVSPETLIGYSRDGFAIYGPVVDESQLDSCGGRYHNFVYQYHVRVSEAFMLGCYAGVPADLNS